MSLGAAETPSTAAVLFWGDTHSASQSTSDEGCGKDKNQCVVGPNAQVHGQSLWKGAEAINIKTKLLLNPLHDTST